MRKSGVAALLIMASLLSGCCALFNFSPEPKHGMPADAGAALKEIKWQISKSEMAVKYAGKAFRNYTGKQLAERKDKLENLYTDAARNGNVYLSKVRESFGEPVLKYNDLIPAAETVVYSVQELYDFAHNDEASAGKSGTTVISGVGCERASASLAEAGVVISNANRELDSGYFNKMYEIVNRLFWKKFTEL